MCLVNCPFGAIADKGQIFQTIHAIKSGIKVFVALAPSFVNQFPGLTHKNVRAAFKLLGFEDVAEVAAGADLCTIEEAHDFLEKVPQTQPFMATSCCPSWSVMAKKQFPELKDLVSMSLTPMVLTGRLIKKEHPGCKVVFVGPCAAKKLEASRRSVRSDVDFVLTFEETMGMFEAKEIDLTKIADGNPLCQASADGRGYAASGGVAAAVVNAIKQIQPGREVQVVSAQGLAECKKMLTLARAGKYNGCLLEGMACPGGCLGGAGTLAPPEKAINALKAYRQDAPAQEALQSGYKEFAGKLK